MQELNHIIDILKNGGVIAAPTDTVYGLLADATNAEAVKKVYAIKGRGEKKALPIFLGSLEWLKDYAVFTEEQLVFLKNVWPGKVTVILGLTPNHSLAKNAIIENTAAFRVPNYKLILEILAAFKKPLIGTSANYSDIPSCYDARCVKKQLAKMPPDLIIDEGELAPSKPSTIIDLTKTPSRVVRKGAGYEKISAFL